MIDDEEGEDDDARVNKIEININLVSLGKETIEPPFLGMFLRDGSTSIFIRLLIVLLFRCGDVIFQSVVCGVLCDALFNLKYDINI
jgi:hypothetical protein